MKLTNKQLILLVDRTIENETEFDIASFTGGYVSVTSTHNNTQQNYRVALFFGYTSKKPITRTVEISSDLYEIWSKAVLAKVLSVKEDKGGMNLDDISRIIGSSTKDDTTPTTCSDTLTLPIPTTLIPSTNIPIEEYSFLNLEAWVEWISYRSEIKKKLTKSSARKQLNFLAKNQSKHIEIIHSSIQNGWTGLFELKNQQKSFKQQDKDRVSSTVDVYMENDFNLRDHLGRKENAKVIENGQQ